MDNWARKKVSMKNGPKACRTMMKISQNKFLGFFPSAMKVKSKNLEWKGLRRKKVRNNKKKSH